MSQTTVWWPLDNEPPLAIKIVTCKPSPAVLSAHKEIIFFVTNISVRWRRWPQQSPEIFFSLQLRTQSSLYVMLGGREYFVCLAHSTYDFYCAFLAAASEFCCVLRHPSSAAGKTPACRHDSNDRKLQVSHLVFSPKTKFALFTRLAGYVSSWEIRWLLRLPPQARHSSLIGRNSQRVKIFTS